MWVSSDSNPFIAKDIDIAAAQDHYASNYSYKYKQSGLTATVKAPVVSTTRGEITSVQRVGESKNNLVNSLAIANAGYGAYKAGDALIDAAKDPLGAAKQTYVSLSYGKQKTHSKSHSSSDQAAASEVNSGGTTNLIATGAGKDSNINIIGSKVSGEQATNLYADNDINIKAAEQTESERSRNKSSGWSAGADVGIGGKGPTVGSTISANLSKGHGNGDGLSYLNSQVGSDTGATNIVSGGTTNIIGGQVVGKSIGLIADNLNIESLQDTATYKGKQHRVSGQLDVGYGTSVAGSYSQSKINSDYASVKQQSGILAGDGGYQIDVNNHTDLKGGIITSTQAAEDAKRNSLSTGTLSYSDIENHANYKGTGFGIDAGGSLSGSTLGQAPNDQLKNETSASGVSKSIGYGKDASHASSITKSGINTGNITITDPEKQQQLDGKSIAETLAGIKTELTTDNYADNAGYLDNHFDKDKVQKEIDTQVAVTKEFDATRQEVKQEIYNSIDKKRQEAEEIRKNNIINGKSGYNTQESLALESSADKWEQAAFYTDLVLGGVYGWGNTAALSYVGTAAVVDPAVRHHTRQEGIREVKCKSDGFYCSNYYDDDKHLRVVDKNSPFAEIGDKRQVFDMDEIKPSKDTGVITISNPGILNNYNDAQRNAVKQQSKATTVYVVTNSPTSNYASEMVVALYTKINDLLGGMLPLSSAEKKNVELYEYAKKNHYIIDLSNHSRGGLTASIALKYANNHDITEIPIRHVRFYGTATPVNDFANQLTRNGFSYSYTNNDHNKPQNATDGGFGAIYNSSTSSAVHDTDFVGRYIGFNKPTGGNEDNRSLYSHSSYFAKKPSQFLVDEQGHYINANGERVNDRVVNPYYEDYNEKWNTGTMHNIAPGDNPSMPVLVKPKNAPEEANYEENPF